MQEKLSDDQARSIFKMIRRYQQKLHRGPHWAEVLELAHCGHSSHCGEPYEPNSTTRDVIGRVDPTDRAGGRSQHG
jgi:hypothetical protein